LELTGFQPALDDSMLLGLLNPAGLLPASGSTTTHPVNRPLAVDGKASIGEAHGFKTVERS
jgi:hypothetical protein